jgi:hypothetical protein
MLNNRVLCKKLTHNIDEPIRGIYYPPSWNQNSDMVINADVMHEVVSVPDSLVEDRQVGWRTEIETEVGDLVWTDIISALNAPEIEHDGDTYRMIRYHKLMVAKRGEKIIPLNGYLLMENFYTREVVGMDFEKGVPQYGVAINYALAWVKYKGKKNKKYLQLPETDDGKNVNKEVLVVLDMANKNENSYDRNYIDNELRPSFSKHRYFPLQRRKLLAVIEKEDT